MMIENNIKGNTIDIIISIILCSTDQTIRLYYIIISHHNGVGTL